MSTVERFYGPLEDSHTGEIGRILAGEMVRDSGVRSEDLPRAEGIAERVSDGSALVQDLDTTDLELLQLFYPVLAYYLKEGTNDAA